MLTARPSLGGLLHHHQEHDPAALEIEIPEDIALADLDLVEPMQDALRAIGISLALDDLGGGLSPVAHLVGLPVDSDELDRSVVTGRT